MKVKICGITKLDDALFSIQIGVWALGFIFYKKSPRYIAPEKVRKIINKLPKNIEKIGVFVNSNKEEIESIGHISGITTYQLHGEETPELCKSLNKNVIKAFRISEKEDLENIKDYSKLNTFLIDSKVKGQYGGTGKIANWELAKEAKKYGNIILAGGINSENILQAIEEVNPYAIDLSSSVEIEPGIKNHSEIEKLLNIVKRGQKYELSK